MHRKVDTIRCRRQGESIRWNRSRTSDSRQACKSEPSRTCLQTSPDRSLVGLSIYLLLQSTCWSMDEGLLLNNQRWIGVWMESAIDRGTCMSPWPESTATLQLTHIFYRQFSRSYSNDAWGVFCRRICLGESFWGRSSGFGVAPRWDGDLSETSPTARSMVSRSVLPCN